MKTENKRRRANGEGELKRECFMKSKGDIRVGGGLMHKESSKRNLKRLHTMKDARIRWGVGWV